MLQIQEQGLRPLTTAHLAQTMSLLVLSNQELRHRVQEELDRNPALEWVGERVCPSCHRPLHRAGPCPSCTAPPSGRADGPIVFLSPRSASHFTPRHGGDEDYADLEPAAPEDLPVHVLQQLAADLQGDERTIAAYILSSLDDEGFLQDPAPIVARAVHAPLSVVERVLALIQQADPPGLATECPRQALLVQARLLDDGSSLPRTACRVLAEAFEELGRRDYEGIAARLGLPTGQVKRAASFVQKNLNPYPARGYWGSGRQAPRADPNVYHTPDILITRNPTLPQGPLMVEIFSPMPGWLRVNPLFRQAQSSAPEEHSDEWDQHLERASLFVKCMQQRNNTMRRLLEILVTQQQDFIVHGDRFLQPMTRAKIAHELGVHESTVSRAVAHKAVAFPGGRIVPLMRFFDRSLSVRDVVKEIVSGEKRPLTDDQIVAELGRRGIAVARRTVAKYRAVEGILPARLRHPKQEAAAARI